MISKWKTEIYSKLSGHYDKLRRGVPSEITPERQQALETLARSYKRWIESGPKGEDVAKLNREWSRLNDAVGLLRQRQAEYLRSRVGKPESMVELSPYSIYHTIASTMRMVMRKFSRGEWSLDDATREIQKLNKKIDGITRKLDRRQRFKQVLTQERKAPVPKQLKGKGGFVDLSKPKNENERIRQINYWRQQSTSPDKSTAQEALRELNKLKEEIISMRTPKLRTAIGTRSTKEIQYRQQWLQSELDKAGITLKDLESPHGPLGFEITTVSKNGRTIPDMKVERGAWQDHVLENINNIKGGQ